MFRLSSRSPLGVVAVLFTGLVYLLSQMVPNGVVICANHGGCIQLEFANQTCCEVENQTSPMDPQQDFSATSCTNCTDLKVPHHPTHLQPMPSVAATVPITQQIVIALIDWPALSTRCSPVQAAPNPRPPHLIHIATIVIHC